MELNKSVPHNAWILGSAFASLGGRWHSDSAMD